MGVVAVLRRQRHTPQHQTNVVCDLSPNWAIGSDQITHAPVPARYETAFTLNPKYTHTESSSASHTYAAVDYADMNNHTCVQGSGSVSVPNEVDGYLIPHHDMGGKHTYDNADDQKSHDLDYAIPSMLTKGDRQNSSA